MHYILVATDFSETGNSAVYYACSLAQALQYDVTVLHTYMVPVAFSDTPMPLIPVEDALQMAGEGMDGLLLELKAQYTSLQVDHRIVYGDVLDCLQEETGKRAPAVVILGNNGAEDADLWLGSTALEVLRQLDCPVLAVPLTSKFSGLKNICLACDFINMRETNALSPLLPLVRGSKARLHLLHINTEEGAPWDDAPLREIFTGIDLEMHQTATSGSIDVAITGFAESQHMDWLAVIPHHHSFWEGLFHKSHTKAMVRMSHIPVLALHGNRE